MNHNKLIVDSDGGTDDALALLLLIGHGRKPELITTCFGNVNLAQATQNILDTLAVCDAEVPVFTGAKDPLAGNRVDAEDVHGKDGLGGIERPVQSRAIARDGAVEAIIRLLRDEMEEGRKVDVLTLGPLTNLALALKKAPDVRSGIASLWVMGGSCRGRGNVTAAAEFNIYCDPEAARDVFSLPLNTHVVPWEPSLETAVEGAAIITAFSGLPDVPVVRFARDICEHGRALGRDWYDEDFCIMPDPLAAAYLLDSEISLRTIVAGLIVETGGENTRGATIVDYEDKVGLPAVGIVDQADGNRLSVLFAQAMRNLANA
ncbi:nucleoside hydrolase [Polycladidibacter hongkongensis]|uniref:nucleoside hydrolase n=1 Tax=Polycladidibacter hongkongensis TaxID=1647556 RepID=UPI000830B174|nr:nucleoside hydrolase [Pseudovibrio hongkongensis]